MKKIFKTLLTSLIMSSSLLISSCGFSMDESYVITSVKTEELQNGDILVTILYEDEEQTPTTFVVPKGNAGNDGVDGVGIESIDPTQSQDKLYTILTITYSNDETKVITVPNGISITGITDPIVDENGNTLFKFVYSNGTESPVISLPKGDKGEPGKDGIDGSDGIDGREVEFNVTTTHIQWRYKVTDEEAEPDEWKNLIELDKLIGNGIKSVDIKDEDSKGYKKYSVEIVYTNGDTVSIPLADINRWYSENYSPSTKDGYNGDMWYDKSMNIIYVKENNFWIELVNLSHETQIECIVTFDYNVSATDPNKPSLPAGTPLTYTIIQGNSFYDSGCSLPNPTRTGYEFAGWYTQSNPTVVNGMFTDLTIVKKETMTLYAKWIPVEEETSEIEE